MIFVSLFTVSSINTTVLNNLKLAAILKLKNTSIYNLYNRAEERTNEQI